MGGAARGSLPGSCCLSPGTEPKEGLGRAQDKLEGYLSVSSDGERGGVGMERVVKEGKRLEEKEKKTSQRWRKKNRFLMSHTLLRPQSLQLRLHITLLPRSVH